MSQTQYSVFPLGPTARKGERVSKRADDGEEVSGPNRTDFSRPESETKEQEKGEDELFKWEG